MAYYSDYYQNEQFEDFYLNRVAPPVDTPLQAANRRGVDLTMALVPAEEVPFGPARARLTSILWGKNGAVLRAQVRAIYCPTGPAIKQATTAYVRSFYTGQF